VIIWHSNHFDFDFVAECNVFDSLPHPCVKGMHAYDYTVLCLTIKKHRICIIDFVWHFVDSLLI